MSTSTSSAHRGQEPQRKRESLAFIARAVFHRRRELGLTRLDLAGRGGPSDTTLARIEAPTVTTAFLRPSTLNRLDTGLRWAAGSAAGCLFMRDPIPVDTGAPEPRTDAVWRWPDTVELPTELLRHVLSTVDSIQPDSSGDSAAAACLRDVADVMRWAYLTREIEDIRAAGREIPDHLAIGVMSALMNAATAEPAPSVRHNDRPYLRWLVGLDDEDPDGRFRTRLSGAAKSLLASGGAGC